MRTGSISGHHSVDWSKTWNIEELHSIADIPLRTPRKAGFGCTNKFDIVRPGINAAYQLDLSKLGFILNLGYYLSGKEKSNGPLYEKISFQYCFTKHLFANVMLKVHWGRADYIGWGVGYRFEKFYGKKTVK